ncbi:MAG: hypothetical protein NT059_03235 [Planctomycetota bacterium]|nr:hypothetical protein [Planctomycetota bacterium]
MLPLRHARACGAWLTLACVKRMNIVASMFRATAIPKLESDERLLILCRSGDTQVQLQPTYENVHAFDDSIEFPSNDASNCSAGTKYCIE